MQGRDHYAMGKAMVGGEESASRMSEELGAEPEAPAGDDGWTIESVNARPAENGGVIVTCSKRRKPAQRGSAHQSQSYEDTYQSKDYAFGSVDEALAYIGEELNAASGSQSAGAGVMATQGAPRSY